MSTSSASFQGRAVVAAWRDGRTHNIDLTLG
jgi:hypothetical protein